MPEVFGRETELLELQHFVDRIPEGPCALVLEGEPGIGKTTLWDAALTCAGERGVRVIWCRPAESEARLSYAGWGDLLRDVGDMLLDPLPEPQRHALDVALLRSASHGDAVDHRAVAAATLGVLRALSDRSPVLVALDDQQWLDRQSATLVEYCARRLRDEPVGFLACGRLVEGRSDPLHLGVALGDGRFSHHAVKPLGHDAIGLLLARRLGLTLPAPTMRRIHAAVGGNPFFALEVGRAIMHDPGHRVDHELPVPADVRKLLRTRMGELTAGSRELVEVASACARPSWSLLGSAVGPEASRASFVEVEGTEILTTEGDDVRFVHPLFAAAAYAGMSPRRRREVHARLASLVPDPEERARHLALGSEPPDEKVAATLEATASGIASRGAPISAAELFEEAARFTPGERTDAITRLWMLAADQHFLAGGHPRAIELVEKAIASLSPGPERAEALLRLGRLMFYWDLPRAAEVLREAEEDDAPPGIRAQVHVQEAWVAGDQMDVRNAIRHGRAAVRLAQEAGDPAAYVSAVAALCGAQQNAGIRIDRQLLDRAVALEHSVRLLTQSDGARFILAAQLWLQGEYEEARRIYRAMLAEARAHGDEMTTTDMLLNLGRLEFEAGNWDAALASLREMYEFDVQIGYPTLVPAARMAIMEAHRGELELARSHAAEAIDVAVTHAEQGSSMRALDALAAGGIAAAVSCDRDAAVRDLGKAWGRLAASHLGPAFGYFLPDLADLLIGLGREKEVEPIAAWLEEKGTLGDDALALALGARVRGLLAAATGDLDRAACELEAAVEHHRRVEVPFERARTLLVLGSVRRHAKRKRSAREALEEALAIFEELGAAPWVERTRAELSSIAGRPSATGELTPTEERVARLAAAGRTNREIAQTLFLSVRTIETHLSHAYRKLGVRSRTELVLVLGPPPTA